MVVFQSLLHVELCMIRIQLYPYNECSPAARSTGPVSRANTILYPCGLINLCGGAAPVSGLI